VTKGTVVVGYRLFNDVFHAKSLSNQVIIGDFSLIYGKVSEFLYIACGIVKGFCIRKTNFEKIIADKIGKKLIPILKQMYLKNIRTPVNIHRKF